MSGVELIPNLVPYFRQLDGYQYKRAWHIARCPLHNDEKQSLGLSTRKGVLRCFAGCEFGDLLRYFKSQGFEPDGERPRPVVDEEWRTVATYQFVDPNTGEVVGIKHRQETPSKNKKFWWERHRDLKDMPLWGLFSIKDKSRPVFFTEGEKAADALHKAGQQAVTTGGGAGLTDISAHVFAPLKGYDVVIWRDNDEPGLRYATAMARHVWSVAKSARIVCWGDAPPGADAFDYLQAGRDIDDILAEKSVTAEEVDDDHIRVTVTTDLGPVSFDFESIRSVSLDEIKCELTVTMLTPAGIDTPFNCRINVLSMSSRQQLVTQLNAQFADIKKTIAPGGWTEVVSRAWASFTGIRKNTNRAHVVYRPKIIKSNQWVVEDLLPAQEDSILFAAEAAGKSLTAKVIAACVATGTPFGGSMRVSQGGVLYVDWERDQQSFEERMERILMGLGIDPDIMPTLPLRYWPGNGIPFIDQAHTIQKAAKELGAQLVILDSLGFAVSGDLFNPEAPMTFYRKRMGVATLAIGQEPDGQKGKLYGNRYWRYAVHGQIWYQKLKRRTRQKMTVDFTNTKFSEGHNPQPFSLDFYFNPDRSIVVETDEAQEHNVLSAVASFLADTDGGARVIDIVGATGYLADDITHCLGTYEGIHFEAFEDEKRVQRWRLCNAE